MRTSVLGLAGWLSAATAPIHGQAPADPRASNLQVETINVFEDLEIRWDRLEYEKLDRKDDPGRLEGSHMVYGAGQVVQTNVDLPVAPEDQAEARRIVVHLEVEPVVVSEGGARKPGDPWTRLGAVSLVLPDQPGQPAPDGPALDGMTATQPRIVGPNPPPGREVELLRFITGFGAAGTYQADVTPLAPLLSGRVAIRVYLSTFRDPAWKVTLRLEYSNQGIGSRRPRWAAGVIHQPLMTSLSGKVKAFVDVPEDLDRPRLMICSTGHATDGQGGDEFISRTHILRVDGREVARWRPWAEIGANQGDLEPSEFKAANPMSGRVTVDGRELWSSELDRSGWLPGMRVRSFRIPVPELTPGRHQVELEILGIRPRDESGYGYWRTSVIAIADEPWPKDDVEP